MSAAGGDPHVAYTREGWATRYDRFRPSPPEALVELLLQQADVERPRLVVDLGCGTGLSTVVWAGRADRVLGIEANELMLGEARIAAEVEYRQARAEATGLDDSGADIVTCSQSFHWMDPGPTLSEAARILRPGGVFAAYEYDVPPLTSPTVDDAFDAVLKGSGSGRGVGPAVASAQLTALRTSGAFRWTREALLHRRGETDTERLLGFAQSLGQVGRRLDEGANDADLGLDRLHGAATAAFGDHAFPIWWCYRIALGVR